MSREPSRYRARRVDVQWDAYLSCDKLIAEIDRQHLRDGYKRAEKVRGSFRAGRFLTLCFAWSKWINGVRFNVSHIVQLDIGGGKAREAVTP